MNSKRCSKCKKVKPLDEFSKRKERKSGYGSRCKECMNEQHKAWRKGKEAIVYARSRAWKAKHKEHIKEYNFLKKLHYNYGLSKDDYNRMLDEQDSKCLICDKRFTDKLKPCVDHNHETGEIRGLLCIYCNTMLGYAKDSCRILEKGIVYLKSF